MQPMGLEEQINWYAQRTPSELSGLAVGQCPELGLGCGGHGEEIAIGRRLQCKCGAQKFEVSAFRWKRDENAPETLLSPVLAVCSGCNKEITVFDCEQHGYGPIACDTSSTAHGQKEPTAEKEDLNGHTGPQTVDIVHYYPDDLFDPEFDEFSDRRADLFTWVRIVLEEDTGPGHPDLSFECA